MEEQRKIYTLYLNSNTGFNGLISNSNYCNVSWNVDWDSLFNRENYNYKNCRLRFRMVGENNATSIQTTDGNVGVLVGNFGQGYTGKNVPYVVLGAIDLKRSASYSSAVWTNTGTYIDINTMSDAHAQQIDMPKGLNALNLQLWKNGYGVLSDTENVLLDSSSTIQYYIIFQFELFN